jgi:hypothetical protein
VAQLAISQSVGDVQADGTPSPNAYDDVLVVQYLLNLVSVGDGGPAIPLTLDGACGDLTLQAIRGFQQKTAGVFVDGRVDPGQTTMQALNARDLHQFEGITDVEERRSIILRPLPAWNFTRGDFTTLTNIAGLALTFDPDSTAWLPQGIQDQLTMLFNLLLDPAHAPAATWGVGPTDWFHCHLSLWSGVFGQSISAASTSWIARRKVIDSQVAAIRQQFADSAGDIIAANIVAYKAAYFARLQQPDVRQLLDDYLLLPEAFIVHHTFEGSSQPSGMAPDDVRRHWMTQAGGQISTPPYRTTAAIAAAGDSPGGRNEFILESSADLSFVISQDGTVHVAYPSPVDLSVFIGLGSADIPFGT